MIQNVILIIIIIIMSVVVIKHMLNDPNGKPVYPMLNYYSPLHLMPESLYIDTNAGSYTINTNLQFTFDNKPNIFHRTFTRILLGWKWKDND